MTLPCVEIEIKKGFDVVMARRAGRNMAKELGLGSADQTRLATAISELTRNIVQYAGSGRCLIQDGSTMRFLEINVLVTDSGPGIADLEEAMTDGFSTGGGLGAGLPGTRRLVHFFEIASQPGDTRIRISMRRHRK